MKRQSGEKKGTGPNSTEYGPVPFGCSDSDSNRPFDLADAPTFAAHGGASQLSLQISGNNLYLNFTPVPEPGSILAVTPVLAGVVVRRRFRREG